MTYPICRVGGFRLEGNPNNLQLVLLSDANDELIRYRLTPEIIDKLAVELPLIANRFAEGGRVDESARSEYLQK